MDELSRLFVAMESQETRLLGIAHCIVPKEQLPIEVPPVFVAPLLPASILNAPIPALSKAILDSKPGIVQLIMPVALEPTSAPSTTASTPISASTAETASKTTSSETLETTTMPIAETIVIVTQSEAEFIATTPKEVEDNLTADRSMESTNFTETKVAESQANMSSNDVNIDNKVMEGSHVERDSAPSMTTTPSVTETIETTTRPIVITTSTFSSIQPLLEEEEGESSTATPVSIEVTTTTAPVAEIILRQQETISMAPEQDNYVYETFSVVPEVIGPMDERAQQLVLVEQPPEDLPNDAAPAA